jgi:hypothetical protein
MRFFRRDLTSMIFVLSVGRLARRHLDEEKKRCLLTVGVAYQQVGSSSKDEYALVEAITHIAGIKLNVEISGVFIIHF